MSKPTTVVVVAVLLIIAVWASATYFPNSASDASAGKPVTSATTSTFSSVGGVSSAVTNPQSASSGKWLSDNPAFVGNTSKVDYPADYGALANFTLSVINRDRISAHLGPVILSSVLSGQQHADSMAYYGYFSHWDNQGYKPYMRYTLLGGTGGVSENAAVNYCTTSPSNSTQPTPAPCSLQTVENAINGSEWEMMNNDAACCNNGHRANILQPIHGQVSVGVAYNSTTVYLVEDFEDNYIGSESLQLSGGVVTFQGTMQQDVTGWMKSSSGSEITVFYDPTPSNIDLSELNQSTSCNQYNELNEPTSCQYQGAYNPGTQISTVFAPCPVQYVCGAGNYTHAQTWQLNSRSFEIVFSISALESAHGNGVYTFYLWPAERVPEPITSLSIFVTGG